MRCRRFILLALIFCVLPKAHAEEPDLFQYYLSCMERYDDDSRCWEYTSAESHNVNFQSPALSPADMGKEATKKMEAMLSHRTTVNAALTAARAALDSPRVVCLMTALQPLDATLKLASERLALLKSAAGRNDAEATAPEFRVVATYHERVLQIAAQASHCTPAAPNPSPQP